LHHNQPRFGIKAENGAALKSEATTSLTQRASGNDVQKNRRGIGDFLLSKQFFA
jgi:hypothetical protein